MKPCADALPIRKKLVSRSRCSALRVLKMEEDSQNQGEALFLAPAPSPGAKPRSCGRSGTREDGRWRCHLRNSPEIGLKCENGEHSLATLTCLFFSLSQGTYEENYDRYQSVFCWTGVWVLFGDLRGYLGAVNSPSCAEDEVLSGRCSGE